MKTVLVTGTSRGLGLAIARRLIADGFAVVGLSRNCGEGFAALCAADPGKASFVPLDLADADAIAEVTRQLVKEKQSIYGLVNNAAAGFDGVLATTHKTDIDRVLRTNLIGPITLAKYAMRGMLRNREGRIVNITSISASTGYHGLSIYSASKAGLEGFTRSLAREAGKMNIAVNCVAPGYLDTDMSQTLQGERLEQVRRRAPLGMPSLEQVAATVAFLLSPEAGSITGTVIPVDGGSSA